MGSSRADRLNTIPFAIMAGGWLGPLLMFWLYVWGPFRPYSYPPGHLLPDLSFAPLVAGCIALWWVLPRRYFRVHRFERTGRLYEKLGVRAFRHVAPDGDLINRWVRRSVPGYRVVQGRRAAAALVARTERSERGHAVLLMLGMVSAGYAWALGWRGWALYLTVGNLLVNLYPILLQRYTRSRLHSILHRATYPGR